MNNEFIPYPTNLAPHYNPPTSNTPCDALVGPCSCGAWHNIDEPWVKETLALKPMLTAKDAKAMSELADLKNQLTKAEKRMQESTQYKAAVNKAVEHWRTSQRPELLKRIEAVASQGRNSLRYCVTPTYSEVGKELRNDLEFLGYTVKFYQSPPVYVSDCESSPCDWEFTISW